MLKKLHFNNTNNEKIKLRLNAKNSVRDAEGGEAGTAPSVARGLPKRTHSVIDYTTTTCNSPEQPDPSVSEGHALIKIKIKIKIIKKECEWSAAECG